MAPPRAAAGAAWAVLAAAACLAALPARADCFDWQDGAAVSEDGTIRGLPPGPVRFRIGRAAAGGPHLSTAVELRWTGPDRREVRQILFDGIQEGRPLLAVRRGGQLTLRLTHCPPGEDCRDTTLAFAWDPAQRRFAGADPAARAALAAECAAGRP